MADTSESKTEPRVRRKPRGKWQWSLSLGLIGLALLALVPKYLAVWPWPFWRAAEFRAIKVPPELRACEVVPAEPGGLAGCNLLLVTLDTTRADRLGCYGFEDIETPTLDRLAREGVLFSQAIAPTPTTLPSHTSILTGLYAHHHGARANALFRLPEEVVTLAEVLSANGYATCAKLSAFVLDARYGLAQGFDDYDDDMSEGPKPERFRSPERLADQTTERAVEWLQEHGSGRFFMWVHYFSPHAPYKPPSPYAEQYKDAPYDGEIVFADAQFGRLLEAVDKLGLTDSTLVVAVGDHGEGLGQHDEYTHGALLYDATLRVPLIMRCGQRLGGGVHISRQVSAVDILPTVLSLLGLESPPNIDGVDLTQPLGASRLIFAETLEGRMSYALAPLLAVQDGTMKYIHGPDPELYDHSQDPFEQENVFSSRPQAAQALKQRLTEFFGGDLEQAVAVQPTMKLTGQDLAALEGLGYVRGGSEVPAGASLPDPKKMMKLKRRVELTLYGEHAEDVNAIIADIEEVLEEHPDLFIGHYFLAGCYAEKNDFQRAGESFQRCLELRTDMAAVLLGLARVKVNSGQMAEAIALYRRMLELYPDHFPALRELGRLFMSQQRFDEAADCFKQAFQVLPTSEKVTEDMLFAMSAAGRADEAIQILEDYLADHPQAAVVRNSLATLLCQKEEYGRAVAMLRKGVELSPQRLELANNYAFLLVTCPDGNLRRPFEAAMLMERVCQQTQYNNPRYQYTLCTILGRLHRIEEAIVFAEKGRQLAEESGDTLLARKFSVLLESLRKAKEEGVTPMAAPPAFREGAILPEEGKEPAEEQD